MLSIVLVVSGVVVCGGHAEGLHVSVYIYIYQISMAAGAYRPRRFAEYSADSEKVVVPILWCLRK